MYQPLPKSYKGVFPFKIGTTSFIYPDGYIPNVETLGPYLEEIELLLFESTPENHLPDKEEISKLGLLAEKYQLTYNIHLPIDLYLGDENLTERSRAVDSLKRITKLVSPLSPSTCTLHLIYNSDTYNLEKVNRWQRDTYDSLSRLMESGINAADISIENLNYPFEWIETFISEFDFMVCLDFGHIFQYALDADIILDGYREKISIIHINGFEKNRDHISLDRLSQEQLRQIMNTLRAFQGTVSLEVFSFSDLTTSLNLLENSWRAAS
jgi:sugar phosphate isomerase/epimerase